MSLTDLLNAGRLRRHSTSAQEIADLRQLAQRDLADAHVTEVSTDRRFSAAYHAALALAGIPLACVGYRTTGPGHHVSTFEALPLVLGEEFREIADYFDVCRSKRNVIEYRRSGSTSDEEVEELIEAVETLHEQLLQWLQDNYSEFV